VTEKGSTPCYLVNSIVERSLFLVGDRVNTPADTSSQIRILLNHSIATTRHEFFFATLRNLKCNSKPQSQTVLRHSLDSEEYQPHDMNTPGTPGTPGTPVGNGPLNVLSPDRVNQQRTVGHSSIILSSVRAELRDSSVHEKISQFNTLALHGKQLERKTADAALSRAMLGREEAEAEMRRYRDEAKALRMMVEEGRERERKVGERLEHVMVSGRLAFQEETWATSNTPSQEQYGRAKEMHAHTQSLWEKEIRRQRKEYYKAHSSGVKHAEELKTTKTNLTMAEELLAREKDRSRAREQEAFAARYQIVGVQEQLEQALERIKVLEQERDAFKTLAKNEEVARIAAEGCLPLPPAEKDDDEFSEFTSKPRVSLSTVDIVSSAASEEELEELMRQAEWESRRADRAQDHVEFLLLECQLRCCSCAQSARRASIVSPRRKKLDAVEIADAGDLAILAETRPLDIQVDEAPNTPEHEPRADEPREDEQLLKTLKPKASRRSTIFCPREGIFRTLSQQEAEAMESAEERSPTEPPTPVDFGSNPRMFARTPSVDPPSFALLVKERTSLISLLNAPHNQDDDTLELPDIPTVPDVPVAVEEESQEADENHHPEREAVDTPEGHQIEAVRPHTSAAVYTVTETTTVPVQMGSPVKGSTVTSHIRSQSNSSGSRAGPIPKVSREEALAQIRERRGRARSAAQGTTTPRRQMMQGVDRRDLSAPTTRMASKVR
jgi:hypothetical protein